MPGTIGGPPPLDGSGVAFQAKRSPASSLISPPEVPGFFSSQCICSIATSCSDRGVSSSFIGVKQFFLSSLPKYMSFLRGGVPWLRRRAAGTTAPWVVSVFLFFVLSDGLAMGFTSKHSLSGGPGYSSPSSLSLFPGPAHPPISGIQTGAREAPPLNLAEHDSCIFTGTVSENEKLPRSTVELKPSQWAEHVEDKVALQEGMKAYQTTDIPGRERQFMLSFKLPSNLAETGSAILTMDKEWDGSSHGWRCSEHILRVTRLMDDRYLQGRNAASETEDMIDWTIGQELAQYTRDLQSLVYGKGLAGQTLHLLFREVKVGCLSAFYTPTGGVGEGPVLAVQVVDAASEDAVYGQWEPFGKCRVSCVTRVNFQCRKRSCNPGKNDGAACKMELMVDKQPCSDPSVSEPCTCSVLENEAACPSLSTCDESTPNNVSCSCSGRFTRFGVDTKTICEPRDIHLQVVGCVVGVKRRPTRDEDLLIMNLDPQTGAPAPGTADLGASMFWGQSPTIPMGAPPGGPSVVGRGPYGPAAGGMAPRMGQGGAPQMAGGYGMGGPPQAGGPRASTFSPMPPGTRL
ncbi:hypothetical protein ACSSS7_002019 [Eimeria intestinalis]